ncbi:DUF4350 domain-containing protein [Arenibacter certesii]|uniref:DUF4350 domain-containing protein n=1 Tax=Arenibacter certesii TaxID=228955 RepID=A0A918IUH2_9FLAO|nr:DUF4350 domain-containing protein [Arenibacter certesii]GGW33289.1 hypothetical protein GCM10007383_17940 [Arenibacter certesii]
MDKQSKIIVGIFIAVLLGIIITEIVRPKPVNWNPSYTMEDKIPFGCYVLFEELPQLFPDQELITVNESLYNILSALDTTKNSNYLLINNSLELGKQETNQLLSYVHSGNDAFIAATSYGAYLSDTLHLKVESLYTIQEDTMQIRLTNPLFPKVDYALTRGLYNTHFTSVDTLNTTVLGHISFLEKKGVMEVSTRNKVKRPNFIRVKFGKGNFYLNTTPQAFTNYYMLGGNENYVGNSLSYLKNATVYWDNYKKAGRVIIDSPMRFVLNQPALKWAYYLGTSGILIFVLFKAKREQRIIPIIKPLDNSSIDFVKTVGGIYFEHKDYSDLIAKKTNYFLAYLRSHFYINTQQINDKTVSDLSARSGKSISETKAMLDLLIHLKNKNQHNEQDLINLNKKIDQFKK